MVRLFNGWPSITKTAWFRFLFFYFLGLTFWSGTQSKKKSLILRNLAFLHSFEGPSVICFSAYQVSSVSVFKCRLFQCLLLVSRSSTWGHFSAPPTWSTRPTPGCTTTASPQPSFGAFWRVGDAVVGRGNAGRRTTSKSDVYAHARTAYHGLPQKILEGDFCWIVPHVLPPTTPPPHLRPPNRSRDWSELSWTTRFNV